MVGSRVVIVFGFVVLASCGGGSGSDDGAEAAVSADAAAPVPNETAVAVGRNVEAHGDAGAFAVTVAALDRGYSVTQIVDGSPVSADGSIAATPPAGSPLGLLSVDVQGFAPARQDDEIQGTLLLRVEFLAATLNEIHGASSDNYEADARQAAEEAQEEFTDDHYHLAFAVLTLVGRGYTVEQAMQGVFFDEMSFETAVCVRLPEKPAGVAIPGASANCKPITTGLDEQSGPSTDFVTEPDASLGPDTEPSGEEAAVSDGTYTGIFDPQVVFLGFGTRYLDVLQEYENTVAVVVEGGAVASFNATIHVSNPFYRTTDSAATCPNDMRMTMVAVPGSTTATTFDIELTRAIIEPLYDEDTSDGYVNCLGKEETLTTYSLPASMVSTSEGVALYFGDDEKPASVLTRA